MKAVMLMLGLTLSMMSHSYAQDNPPAPGEAGEATPLPERTTANLGAKDVDKEIKDGVLNAAAALLAHFPPWQFSGVSPLKTAKSFDIA